jgi:hypothetical protein
MPRRTELIWIAAGSGLSPRDRHALAFARPDPMGKAASPTTETTAWTAGAVPA